MELSARSVLEAVREGRLSVEEALARLRAPSRPFADIGFAKVDLQRRARQGAPEVVYGAGKTAPQICAIVRTLALAGQAPILVTRLDLSKINALKSEFGTELTVFEDARMARLGPAMPPEKGKVAVVSAGTSDQPVAEEAAVTAETFGCEVVRCYDAGVAGLHRLLAAAKDFMSADVIIAVAGMEGALPSVIGGLVDRPVVAVPTSVGYGASFGGVTALLAMLNSCASGVAVMNIDNGFGAGMFACRVCARKNAKCAVSS